MAPVTLAGLAPAMARGVAFASVTLLGLLALGVGPATAHASLVRASPADGSTVSAAPARVTLTFDETVRTPVAVVVNGPDGRRVSTGKAEVLDNTASTAVTIETEGSYTVAFRVVSSDGHPIAERTIFRFAGGGALSAARSPEPAKAAAGTEGDATPRRTWVTGGIAGAALLGGVALLTLVRRGSPPAREDTQ